MTSIDRQRPAVRLRVVIRGVVQGVGFRPFVFVLAEELGLSGWVSNTTHGVFLEVEGPRERVEEFLLRLEPEAPEHAVIQSLEPVLLDPVGFETFAIRHSHSVGGHTLVLPDIATCDACLAELFDPADRRYRYPFTNCTRCGPRYSIIERLPYDRANTSMRHFVMCDACREEYENPRDRRFHAQPNACPVCGPRVSLTASDGRPLAMGDEALQLAAEAVNEGRILALKGIGGFQLLVDARDDAAVRRLRERKRREEKPFALMAPSQGEVEELAEVATLERRLLRAPEAPIVLLERRADPKAMIAPSVAPGTPTLAVMLPYSPLHHVLMQEIGRSVVATSGNVSDEPICTDNRDALDRLGHIADVFLTHDRPIVRHVDDSITRIILDREIVLRRARGYAPLPAPIDTETDGRTPPTVVAFGAHQKNTVALALGGQAIVSQHIGDLETAAAVDASRRAADDLPRLYGATPEIVACDLHPDYASTRAAKASGRHVVSVQHHYAHVLACMAENAIEPPVLGVAWDGTGYGPDATVWGGEFLLVDDTGYQRVARLHTFRLPGGEGAVREPRRSAVGALREAFGAEWRTALRDTPPVAAFSAEELRVLETMLSKGLNTPLTSSAGRLFDAVASIVGIRQRSRYEGQAAMELEYACRRPIDDEPLPFAVEDIEDEHGLRWSIDWRPMLRRLVEEVRGGRPAAQLAAAFHATLVEMILAVAGRADVERVALSGGCFQNRVLTERAVVALRRNGFGAYWHQRIPPNDGGISLGQLVAAQRSHRAELGSGRF